MSKRFLIGWLCALSTLAACNNPTVPRGILPPDSMKVMLWDMFRADELAANDVAADSALSLKKQTEHYYGQVLFIHKTDTKTFSESYRYYQKDPALFKALMDSVYAYGERNANKPNRILQKPVRVE